MPKREGFTIVEIVVVMVIMAILLTLTTVNLSSSQVSARDEQRKSNMETLARALENRYRVGNTKVTSPLIRPGSYPSTAEMSHIMGNTQASLTPSSIAGGYVPDALAGATKNTLTSPAASTPDLTLIGAQCITAGNGENTTTITSSNAGCMGPSGKYNIFYTSVTETGAICNTVDAANPCVRYMLFTRMEKDNSLMTIRSQRQ